MRTVFYADGYGIDSPDHAAEGLAEFIILQYLRKEGMKIDSFQIHLIKIEAGKKIIQKLVKSSGHQLLVFQFSENEAVVFANAKGRMLLERLDIKNKKILSGIETVRIMQNKKPALPKRKTGK